MLNRIYIIVGVLAIVVLAAAFAVPRFVQWDDYRDRMEAVVGKVLGAPVTIRGDISFALLPSPHIEFSDVAIGPADEPVVQVEDVAADFSLLDFLRDRYAVNRLSLSGPQLHVTVDESGLVSSGLNLAGEIATANVSISDAQIVDGSLWITDLRSGQTTQVNAVDGTLHLQRWSGPLDFTGSATLNDQRYSGRISTGIVAADGSTPLSLSLQPDAGGYSMAANGTLATGVAPRFAGDFVFRQTPAPADNADGVRGDLVFTSKLEASTDQLLFSAYTLQPDENRAATRLTGAAAVHLGAAFDFEAVISGGVAALPPRDATAEEGPQPIELVRLLDELPEPVVPPIPGTIGLDLAEVGLRTVSLRNLRVDAMTDGKSWTITDLDAELPGETQLKLSGNLAASEGRPQFTGKVALQSGRLDAFAAQWRKAGENNALVDASAALAADVDLSGDQLALTHGALTVDGAEHSFNAAIAFGPERRLDLKADFGTLTDADSAVLAALLPDLAQSQALELTFPDGRVALSAGRMALFGLEGTGIDTDATWSGGVLHFDKLAAVDLGGLGLDLSGTLGGVSGAPTIIASGKVSATNPAAPGLTRFYQALNVTQPVRDFVARSLPADLSLGLEQPDGNGMQVLTASGKLGSTRLGLSAQLSGGIAVALDAPLALTADLQSSDPLSLTRQLGLGEAAVLPQKGAAQVRINLKGTPGAAFDTSIAAEGSGDSFSFTGSVNGDASAPSGKGKLKLELSDGGALAQLVGAGGLGIPVFQADADVAFAAGKSLTLSNLKGTADQQPFTGNLALTSTAEGNTIAGSLQLGALNLQQVTAGLAGPSSLFPGSGPWPSGPLAIGGSRRSTTGSVVVTATSIDLGNDTDITGPSFELAWDADEVDLRGLQGQLGGGNVALDITACCAGASAGKQLTGRLALTEVDLSAILPPSAAAVLKGRITAGARFESNGESLSALAANASGEGSYTVDDLQIEKFDPAIFQTVAGLDNILDLDADALTNVVALSLDKAPFTAPSIQGTFSIVAGQIRADNLTAQGALARLFGSATLKLADFSLGGSVALTPVGGTGNSALINENTARVTAILDGTLPEPRRELDLNTMADAIKVRAYELEVARLEKLKQEDDARQQAAAQERQRLLSLDQQRAQQEEAAAAAQQLETNSAPTPAPAPVQPVAPTAATPTPATTPGITPPVSPWTMQTFIPPADIPDALPRPNGIGDSPSFTTLN